MKQKMFTMLATGTLLLALAVPVAVPAAPAPKPKPAPAAARRLNLIPKFARRLNPCVVRGCTCRKQSTTSAAIERTHCAQPMTRFDSWNYA